MSECRCVGVSESVCVIQKIPEINRMFVVTFVTYDMLVNINSSHLKFVGPYLRFIIHGGHFRNRFLRYGTLGRNVVVTRTRERPTALRTNSIKY